GRSVTGEGVGIGGHFPAATPAAGGEVDCLAVEDVKLSGGYLISDDSANRIVDPDEIDNVEFIEEVDLVFDALLVEGLQDHVTGAIGRVAGAHHRLSGLVISVTTEPALGNSTVRQSVEG